MDNQQNAQFNPQFSPVGEQSWPVIAEEKAPKPIVGYIALVVAIIGLLGCIPGALIIGWVALPVAFFFIGRRTVSARNYQKTSSYRSDSFCVGIAHCANCICFFGRQCRG